MTEEGKKRGRPWKGNERTRLFSFPICPSMKDRLQACADALHRDMADLIREGIEIVLTNNGHGVSNDNNMGSGGSQSITGPELL